MGKPLSAIRRARRSAFPPIPQADVAQLLGRSQRWLSAIELGQFKISPEVELAILLTIARLARFRSEDRRQAERAIAEREAELCQDLRLSVV